MKYFLGLLILINCLFGEEISYGIEEEQKYDLYLPKQDNGIVLLMVHGGGWKRGDKDSNSFIENKKEYFLDKGYIISSINYRFVPEVSIDEQIEDLNKAIYNIQNKLGKSKEYILLGHSAGAHLISLLNYTESPILKKWKKVISLDSGALNVVDIMEKRHFRLYDEAFGKNKNDWIKWSPYYKDIDNQIAEELFVCSLKRDISCKEAEKFINKHTKFNNKILRVEKSHREINVDLGKDLEYTEIVEKFMRED